MEQVDSMCTFQVSLLPNQTALQSLVYNNNNGKIVGFHYSYVA